MDGIDCSHKYILLKHSQVILTSFQFKFVFNSLINETKCWTFQNKLFKLFVYSKYVGEYKKKIRLWRFELLILDQYFTPTERCLAARQRAVFVITSRRPKMDMIEILALENFTIAKLLMFKQLYNKFRVKFTNRKLIFISIFRNIMPVNISCFYLGI